MIEQQLVQPLFPEENGGANPTSPLQCQQFTIRQREAQKQNSPISNPNLSTSRIMEIPIRQARQIILKYEWLGTMPGFSGNAYGHFFDGILGGVAVIGHTTGGHNAFTKTFAGKKVIVLQRGVHLWWTPKNSASWFISRLCRIIAKQEHDVITATADPEAGEIGTIYQSLGWAYLGQFLGGGHPVFVIDGRIIHPKTLYDHHGTSSVPKLLDIYKDRMVIEKRQRKHRYAYALDRSYKIESLPYPKREIT